MGIIDRNGLMRSFGGATRLRNQNKFFSEGISIELANASNHNYSTPNAQFVEDGRSCKIRRDLRVPGQASRSREAVAVGRHRPGAGCQAAGEELLRSYDTGNRGFAEMRSTVLWTQLAAMFSVP